MTHREPTHDESGSDDDEWTDEDQDGFDELNCGQMADGTCQYAGTEFCDWSCPYSR